MIKIERFPSGNIKSIGWNIPLAFNGALDLTAAFYIAILLVVFRIFGVL